MIVLLIKLFKKKKKKHVSVEVSLYFIIALSYGWMFLLITNKYTVYILDFILNLSSSTCHYILIYNLF